MSAVDGPNIQQGVGLEEGEPFDAPEQVEGEHCVFLFTMDLNILRPFHPSRVPATPFGLQKVQTVQSTSDPVGTLTWIPEEHDLSPSSPTVHPPVSLPPSPTTSPSPRSEHFDTEKGPQQEYTETPSKDALQDTGRTSVDWLMATWHKVGIQINEVVVELFEESNHTKIGDGTCIGFVNSVLDRIPGVSTVEEDAPSFGHLIYLQTGPSIIERVTDIMPGDIITLHDAKLKGTESASTHHPGIDEGITAVGIIGEYGPRKSTVKAYHANKRGTQQAANKAGISHVKLRDHNPHALF